MTLTLEQTSEVKLAEVHPELARRVRLTNSTMIELHDCLLRVTQGRRTWPQQAALYAIGRTTPGASCVHDGLARRVGTCPQHPWGLTVTRAAPGYTWHCFGLAVDLAPDDVSLPGWQPDWNLLHPVWRSLLRVAKTFKLAEGAEWRTYPDSPHFYPEELPATPDDNVRAAFSARGVQAVWDLYPSLPRAA